MGIAILSELEPFALVTPKDGWRVPEGLAEARPMTKPQVSTVEEMGLDSRCRPYRNIDSLCIAGEFDEAKFRTTVGSVVERHPVLRASFDLVGYQEPASERGRLFGRSRMSRDGAARMTAASPRHVAQILDRCPYLEIFNRNAEVV